MSQGVLFGAPVGILCLVTTPSSFEINDFQSRRESWLAVHASSTDPEARLYKKAWGQEAKLCYLGHTLVENRNGMRLY